MGSRTANVEKITVSLPAELIRYADQRAALLGTSRSQIISQAIARQRAEEEAKLAREGYAFYAEESEEFAATSLRAVSEAIGPTDG